MTDHRKTRREFMRDSAAFAAGAAIALSGVIPVKAKEADTSKILNYNLGPIPVYRQNQCGWNSENPHHTAWYMVGQSSI